MFSLNVPVPGSVERIAADLRLSLAGFDAVPEPRTLVVKRFGDRDPREYDRVESEVRQALAGVPAFEARVSGIGTFEEPAGGPAPVVYAAVESPGLVELHRRLVERFGAVEGVEGEDYVPHVTLARGGDRQDARRLAGRGIDPVTWTVGKLVFWDARHGERVSAVSLPA